MSHSPAEQPRRRHRGDARRRTACRWTALALLVSLAVAACGSGDRRSVGVASLSIPSAQASDGPDTTSPGSVATPSPTFEGPPSAERRFERVARITGAISPKSVVASPTGLVVAQNMMYNHTVTVYDQDHELVATVKDSVVPSEFGYDTWSRSVRGAPVEASFSPDGRHVWVSNYSMYGPGFGPEGSDQCTPADDYDRSFVYRIDTTDFEIDDIVLVGSVPKYVQTSPDGRYVLVTNWCSWDLSIIDVEKMSQVATVKIGRYPRGIAVSPDGTTAYVAAMGTADVAVVDIRAAVARRDRDDVVSWFKGVGRGPRHLNLSPDGRHLYVTLNAEGRVAKVDTRTGTVTNRVRTGKAPRSSALSPDGTALFVVNYESDTVSRVRTSDMKELETVAVDHHPIGITYSPSQAEIWVAAYAGSITVFADEPA